MFYRYLKENHKDVPLKFVITEDSPDRARVDDEDVIKFGSLKHYFLFVTAPVLISTHCQGYSPNLELFSQLDRKRLIKVRGKKILVDHCVRRGNASISQSGSWVDLLAVGIQKQYDAMKEHAGFKDGVLQLIGLARFDNLYKNIGKPTKPHILFMPTWRMKYTHYTEKQFLKSEYYRECMKLINDRKLDAFLGENGLKLVFYTHIEMQKFIHLFKTDLKNVIILDAESAVVEDLLIESRVMITDYSSVFFDFSYLDKPVIYFLFDNDENEAASKNMWFTYEKDALGPCFYDEEKMVDYILNMDMSKPEKLYAQRNAETFNLKDDKNCERNYEAILSLINQN